MTQSRGVQERALADALKGADIRPQDAAIVALARRLAQMLDVLRGEDDEIRGLKALAMEYRLALVQLGLTPAARAAKPASGEAEKPKSPLQRQRDELEAQRAKRKAAGP